MHIVKIIIEREEFQAEIDRLNDNLGSMIFRVVELLENALPTLETVIIYMRTLCEELRPQLSFTPENTFACVSECI